MVGFIKKISHIHRNTLFTYILYSHFVHFGTLRQTTLFIWGGGCTHTGLLFKHIEINHNILDMF